MSAVDEKPGVREQVGVAVNTSALVIEIDPARPGAVSAGDRVTALGYASARVARHGRDGDGGVVPARVADIEDARLSALLLRRREGGDTTVTNECGVLLAKRAMAREVKRQSKPVEWTLDDRMRWTILGVQVVREWCEDRCTECGGTGRVQLVKGKRQPVRGIGRAAVPGSRFIGCEGCNTSGYARTSGPRRASMLGITMAVYEREWQRRFASAALELTYVAALIDGALHSALKRA